MRHTFSDTVTIQVYDEEGNARHLPLDHPDVTMDELSSRRYNVKNVFLPDALTKRERLDYTAELLELTAEIDKRKK